MSWNCAHLWPVVRSSNIFLMLVTILKIVIHICHQHQRKKIKSNRKSKVGKIYSLDLEVPNQKEFQEVPLLNTPDNFKFTPHGLGKTVSIKVEFRTFIQWLKISENPGIQPNYQLVWPQLTSVDLLRYFWNQWWSNSGLCG